MEVYDRKTRTLSDVIAGLTGCLVGNCSNCEYGGDGCHGSDMLEDALFWLKELRTDNARLRQDQKVLIAERDFAANLAQAYGEFVEATLEKEVENE